MDVDKVKEEQQQIKVKDDSCHEARPYQIKLLEAATESNTIVLLGTGAGKTFIAVMLIKQLSAATFRPLNEEGAKRTVFLVNTGWPTHTCEKHSSLSWVEWTNQWGCIWPGKCQTVHDQHMVFVS